MRTLLVEEIGAPSLLTDITGSEMNEIDDITDLERSETVDTGSPTTMYEDVDGAGHNARQDSDYFISTAGSQEPTRDGSNEWGVLPNHKNSGSKVKPKKSIKHRVAMFDDSVTVE